MADISISSASLVSALAILVSQYKEKTRKRAKNSKKLRQTILRYLKNNKRRQIALVNTLNGAVERRFWMEPTRGQCYFWERTISLWTEDRLWIDNFRMTRNTFSFICEELSPTLDKQNTRFRRSIPLQKRVAICLWHLATGEDLRSLGWRFDVAKSTACQIVNECCQAIVSILLPRFITWPTGNSLRAVVDGFDSEWNFPQCVGAIDGTHIPITAPPDSPAYYYNRKGFHSIVMQAVVDHLYRFTDIYIKWPGKVHDARVLSNSGLYLKGQTGDLFPDWTENINGCDVPLFLVGDPAYPLLPWLLKRYQNTGTLSQEQIVFNYRLSKARNVIEGAFGRLKGRFRCLLTRNDTSLKYLPSKIASCCVLHNLCETRGEGFQEAWLYNTNDNIGDESFDFGTQLDTTAQEIREALTELFKTQ